MTGKKTPTRTMIEAGTDAAGKPASTTGGSKDEGLARKGGLKTPDEKGTPAGKVKGQPRD